MMKSGKQLASLLLTAVLASSTLAGCGNGGTNPSSSSSTPQSKTSSSADAGSSEGTADPIGVTYPIPGNVTLTYAGPEEPAVTANATDLGATPFGQALQEATGVTLKIQHYSGSDALNLMLASGDLPDIINFTPNSYSGGAAKAIKDKIVEPLDELIEGNAPDLYALLEEHGLWRKSITSTDGHIIGFPFIRGDKSLQSSAGLMIREDWRKDLSLDVPETPEEFYNMLVAFRDEKGATVPLSLSYGDIKGRFFNQGMMTSPYGIPMATYYQENGVVKYGYNQPGMKDLYAFLNKLYTEGLLDPNFASLDSNTKNANIMNGASGITFGAVGGGIGNYLTTVQPENPSYDLAGIGSLVSNKGDIPMSGNYENPIPGNMSVITPNCKNKEAAAQFLNYGFTEEGNRLFNFGIEGKSYTLVDGVPTYTELITNNPDGLTMQFALAQYTRAWTASDAYVQDPQYHVQYVSMPQQIAAKKIWANHNASQYCMPPVTIAEADSAEFAKLSGDLDTYIDEMAVKFITGVEPLDKFETEYLPTIEKLGIERLIELKQKALDEFNAR